MYLRPTRSEKEQTEKQNQWLGFFSLAHGLTGWRNVIFLCIFLRRGQLLQKTSLGLQTEAPALLLL